MSDEFPKLTLDDLRRIHDEGVEQTLISGVTVRLRPARLDVLLQEGEIPDVLTPILLKGLYEPVQEDLDALIFTQHQEREKAVGVIQAVDAVCRASLVDPSILPYLSLSDRMWIYKLAFMPAEVLSRFRYESTRDVDSVDEGENVQQAAERNP